MFRVAGGGSMYFKGWGDFWGLELFLGLGKLYCCYGYFENGRWFSYWFMFLGFGSWSFRVCFYLSLVLLFCYLCEVFFCLFMFFVK